MRHRLTRILSDRRVGPKEETCCPPPVALSKHQWKEKPELEGADGGCCAVEAQWQEEVERRHSGELERSNLQWRETVRLARASKRDTARAVRRARLRRKPPDWCVPVGGVGDHAVS